MSSDSMKNKNSRIRKKSLRIDLSEDEKKLLDDKSDYAGMNVSQFIRKIITDDNVHRLPVEEIMETSKSINQFKFEINKIGNNINQLVKVVHENNDLYYEEQIKQAISMIENVTQTFNELTKVMYEKLYNI